MAGTDRAAVRTGRLISNSRKMWRQQFSHDPLELTLTCESARLVAGRAHPPGTHRSSSKLHLLFRLKSTALVQFLSEWSSDAPTVVERLEHLWAAFYARAWDSAWEVW
eukprot:Skav218012  [mRNA]  locus=scaffold2344:180989:181312:- [translate_table: standard]